MSQKLLFGMDPLRFFLGSLAVALALGFPLYFGHWVYFAWFPNILDTVTMASVGVVLLWDVVRKVGK
jgi:hypothetical protein